MNKEENGRVNKGCFAGLGFQHPEVWQRINLGPGCTGRYVVQHEMLHTMGFLHEQSSRTVLDFGGESARFCEKVLDVLKI